MGRVGCGYNRAVKGAGRSEVGNDSRGGQVKTGQGGSTQARWRRGWPWFAAPATPPNGRGVCEGGYGAGRAEGRHPGPRTYEVPTSCRTTRRAPHANSPGNLTAPPPPPRQGALPLTHRRKRKLSGRAALLRPLSPQQPGRARTQLFLRPRPCSDPAAHWEVFGETLTSERPVHQTGTPPPSERDACSIAGNRLCPGPKRSRAGSGPQAPAIPSRSPRSLTQGLVSCLQDEVTGVSQRRHGAHPKTT